MNLLKSIMMDLYKLTHYINDDNVATYCLAADNTICVVTFRYQQFDNDYLNEDWHSYDLEYADLNIPLCIKNLLISRDLIKIQLGLNLLK
jgi:hypothetical protein